MGGDHSGMGGDHSMKAGGVEGGLCVHVWSDKNYRQYLDQYYKGRGRVALYATIAVNCVCVCLTIIGDVNGPSHDKSAQSNQRS